MDLPDDQPSAARAASQLAALWRGVRWGAAAFCFLQFAVYVPGDGIRVPWPLLPLGAALALLLALVNISALAWERRQPRTGTPGTTARRDLVLLIADTVVVVAVVQLLAFEPTSAVWVLLVVPVLEAGLVGRLRWALTTCAVAVAALLLRELLAVHLHHLPSPSAQEALSVMGFRIGVLLLVATVIGLQANVAHSHLVQLHLAQEQLTHDAGHDHLTGLPTRRLFLDRAGRALRTAHHHHDDDRRDSTAISLLFIDADHFKALNDTHGHAAGDEILQQIADRLTAHLGPHDTAARLGGDEFAVLLRHPAPPAGSTATTELSEAVRALRAALAQPYTITGHGTVPMTCSVGVATHRHGGTLSTLLRDADQAMYRDKTSTTSQHRSAPQPPAVRTSGL